MGSDEKRARWSGPTFFVGFATILVLLLWISLEFLMALSLAISGAILLSQPNEWLAAKLGGRRWLAGLLMSVATFVVIVGPLTMMGVVLVQEAVPLVDRLVTHFGNGRISALLQEAIPERLEGLVSIGDINEQLRQNLASIASRMAGFLTAVPGIAANLLVDGFITFIALYVYFVRGPQLYEAIVEATPMERRYTRKLLDTTAAAIRTVFVASFITALIQFVLAYVAFRFVGVPYALVLSAVMAFFSFIFSLVPILGSGMVWGPLAVILFVGGRPFAGIFIALWGLLVIGSVDNIVKPLYTKGQLELSPLLVFITLFGGIAVFGPIGALIGPMIAALAAAFLRIWTTEFLTDATPLPRTERQQRKPQGRLLARLRRRFS
jgi:predicted PurR-regulated permease PerM